MRHTVRKSDWPTDRRTDKLTDWYSSRPLRPIFLTYKFPLFLPLFDLHQMLPPTSLPVCLSLCLSVNLHFFTISLRLTRVRDAHTPGDEHDHTALCTHTCTIHCPTYTHNSAFQRLYSTFHCHTSYTVRSLFDQVRHCSLHSSYHWWARTLFVWRKTLFCQVYPLLVDNNLTFQLKSRAEVWRVC